MEHQVALHACLYYFILNDKHQHSQGFKQVEPKKRRVHKSTKANSWQSGYNSFSSRKAKHACQTWWIVKFDFCFQKQIGIIRYHHTRQFTKWINIELLFQYCALFTTTVHYCNLCDLEIFLLFAWESVHVMRCGWLTVNCLLWHCSHCFDTVLQLLLASLRHFKPINLLLIISFRIAPKKESWRKLPWFDSKCVWVSNFLMCHVDMEVEAERTHDLAQTFLTQCTAAISVVGQQNFFVIIIVVDVITSFCLHFLCVYSFWPTLLFALIVHCALRKYRFELVEMDCSQFFSKSCNLSSVSWSCIFKKIILSEGSHCCLPGSYNPKTNPSHTHDQWRKAFLWGWQNSISTTTLASFWKRLWRTWIWSHFSSRAQKRGLTIWRNC